MQKAARAVVLVIIFLTMFIGAQPPASKPAFPVVPPETLAAYQEWMKAENPFGGSIYALASGPALQKLAALPDADLCFLYTTEERRGQRDWLYLAAADELGKLNTQRAFGA